MSALQRDGLVATEGSQQHAEFPANGGLSALLDVLPIGVFVIDGDRKIETVNPAAAALLVFEPAQVSGRRCNEPPKAMPNATMGF